MAIARLRNALEPLSGVDGSRLQTVRGGYLLSVAPGELDADVFHAGVHAGTRALEAGDPADAVALLSAALELWRGPPLAEVAFEDFAQPEIRRLEELRMRAVECRIDAELALGRHADTIGELEALLADAPTREHVAGQLMLALYRSDRQADALAVYGRIRAALNTELGLEPGPALKELELQILEHHSSLGLVTSDEARGSERRATIHAPIPTRVRPHGPSVFAGRHEEREALARAHSALATSGPQAVFVTGEPGIGKTRLVAEFAGTAHADGTLVLAGRCDDGLGVPYQPFVEALEHLIAHAPPEFLRRHIDEYGDSVARLVPRLTGTAAPPPDAPQASESERYVLFRAIEGLLAAASEPGPVLLVVEDLHWADLPTLNLLKRLLTAPRDWALMVVSTTRVDGLAEDHPLRALLAALHREPHVLRLDLTGLDSADIETLVEGITEVTPETVDHGLAAALVASTNGNPFFITELVRSLAETDALTSEDGRLRLADGVDPTADLPLSISETLAQRLRQLPGDVRRCLDVAAVIGEEFDPDLVSELVDAEPAHLSLAAAVDAGVLIRLPGRPARFRFAHTLMQRYLYRQLGPSGQTELHRRIAVQLERRSDPGTTAELARHWMEAVDADVETALGYATRAGDEALEKLAPDDARQWYDDCLNLLLAGHREHPAQQCELLIKRGEAERQAGDRRFRETFLEAAGIAQRTADEDRLVRAALGNTRGMLSETGVVDEARIATLDRALAIVGERDTADRARLLAISAAEYTYSPEWERRVRMSDEALEIARGLDDPDALSSVLNMRFVTLLAPETLAERQANTVEGVAVAERLTDPLVRFFAYHWRAYACIEAGDILGARQWLGREQDVADRYRQPTTLWLRYADEANLAIVAGDLDLADELSTAALEVGRQSEPDALVCYAAQQTSIRFERGTLGELVPLLEQAVPANPGLPGLRATLALALSEASRGDDARGLMHQAMASGFDDLPLTRLAVTSIYAHVSVALKDEAAAAVLYGTLEPWSEQIVFPAFGVWGPVSLYLGSLASLLGDFSAAERHLREAARAASRAGAPIWEARATAQLGQLAATAR
jgi:DNA-binding SARP family transcriptional activator